MKARRGLLARCVDGRLDRSVLSDLGVLAGVGVFGFGLWQYSHPAAWLFSGAVIVGLSVIAVLPPKRTGKAPKGDA